MRIGAGRAPSLAAAAALAAFGWACGSRGGALPDPPPCVSTPAPAETAGNTADGAYLAALAERKDRLLRPTFEFLTRWPSRKYSRRQMFREELAAAADKAACAAVQLGSLVPPSDAYLAYDQALDAALIAYEADMQVGRQAAALRNVTKFRQWLDAVDAFPGLLASLNSLLPAE